MNARKTPSRWLAIALILAAQGLVNEGAVGAETGRAVDVLDQPARASEKARFSLLTAIAAAGPRLVAVGERSIVLLSDDHGVSWRQARSVPTSVALTAVRFVSAQTGWAVGHSGVVLKTVDGGETWVRQLDGRQAAEIELAAANAAGSPEAPTRRQRDAERMAADGPDKPFLDAWFFDERRGLIVGAYGLAFRTEDGGNTWSSLVGRIENPRARHLYHIATDGQQLLMTGEQGNLLRSTDGGQSFSALKIDYPGTLFGAVLARNQAMVVFGLRGNAFRSVDGGATWQKVDFGLPVTLTAGIRLRDGRLVVVDETGRVMLSRDDGASFTALALAKMNAASGVVEAADGALVVSTQRGPVRIPPEALAVEHKK